METNTVREVSVTSPLLTPRGAYRDRARAATARQRMSDARSFARLSRGNLTRRLARVDPVEVLDAMADRERMADARRLWHALGGPGSTSARLFTDPDHQTKARKAKAPQYVLHLAPHRVATETVRGEAWRLWWLGERREAWRSLGAAPWRRMADLIEHDADGPMWETLAPFTACPWSTPSCRAACLFTAGYGAMPTALRGRVARTLFAFVDPVGFLALITRELQLIAKRHPRGRRPLVRFNGTSDITLETVPALLWAMDSVAQRVTFRDYSKAPIGHREPMIAAQLGSRYRVALSAWTDSPTLSTPAQIVDAWRSGASVSVVVDDYAPLAEFGAVVDATLTDEWLIPNAPRIGALEPLGDASPSDLVSGAALADALRAIGAE